ncbi:MAG: response regulator transcription factor [Pseudobutyrivibrio sp.]|nr:response regulator transcription factor [Pseudobutyrivibrio sp.]MBP3727733.1 response regulator transcription factor [Pseudobutyrivibrio sp.]
MIYIVEDDANIRKMLMFAIARAGFEVKEFPDASQLYSSLEEEMPQLLILDIMLPGEDGFTVLEKLRSNLATKKLPVIILTAKNSEIDKLHGLDGGADDYVTKPFGIAELMARIRAVIRRYEVQTDTVYEVANLKVDEGKHIVTVDGNEIVLSKKEYDLLVLLLKAKGNVCSREELLSAVWGENYGESRTLDVHIRKLRHKLDNEDLIETVKGFGYRIREK